MYSLDDSLDHLSYSLCFVTMRGKARHRFQEFLEKLNTNLEKNTIIMKYNREI